MRVVDDEQRRAVRRHPGEQPVEPVQERERRVAVGERAAVGAGQAEHARRELGGVGGDPDQPRALLGGHRHHRRLHELAHDAEAELALELGAAPAQHAQPALGRRLAHGGQHGGLAHPGAALDHQQAAAARAGALQRRLGAGHDVLTLE